MQLLQLNILLISPVVIHPWTATPNEMQLYSIDFGLSREKNWAKNAVWTAFVRADSIWMQ